jgi:hypothetical protein
MKYVRNYAKLRAIMSRAIRHELERKEGHWPDAKAKARRLLANDDLAQLSDTAAAAVLDSILIRVSAVRKIGNE